MMLLALSFLDLAALAVGAISILVGIVGAYVSMLCVNGKIMPNGMVGVRLNISRNYRLYNQEKYWYEINRYGGKQMLPILVAWVLLSLVVLILPLDPRTKIWAIEAIVILAAAVLAISGWRIYRYADKLVSRDIAYIPGRRANEKKVTLTAR